MRRCMMLRVWVAASALLGPHMIAHGAGAKVRPPGKISVVVVLKGRQKELELKTFIPIGELVNQDEWLRDETARYSLGSGTSTFRRKPGDKGPTYEMQCGGHVLYTLANGITPTGASVPDCYWSGGAPKTQLPASGMAKAIRAFVHTDVQQYSPNTGLTDNPLAFDVVYWSPKSVFEAGSQGSEHVSIVLETEWGGVSGIIETKDNWEGMLLLFVSDFGKLNTKSGAGFECPLIGWGPDDRVLNKYRAARRYRLSAGVTVEWLYWTPRWKNAKGIDLSGKWKVKSRPEDTEYEITQTNGRRFRSSKWGKPPLAIRDHKGKRTAVGGFEGGTAAKVTVHRSAWKAQATRDEEDEPPWHKTMAYRATDATSKTITWTKWSASDERYVPDEVWERKESAGFLPEDPIRVNAFWKPLTSGAEPLRMWGTFQMAKMKCECEVRCTTSVEEAMQKLRAHGDEWSRFTKQKQQWANKRKLPFKTIDKREKNGGLTYVTWKTGRKTGETIGQIQFVYREVFWIDLRITVPLYSRNVIPHLESTFEACKNVVNMRFPPGGKPGRASSAAGASGAASPSATSGAQPNTKRLSSLLWARRLNDALAEYRRLAQTHPNHVTIRTGRASMELAVGDRNVAAAEAEALSRQFPDHPNVLILCGQVAQRRGDQLTARQMYGRALVAHPTQAQELYGQAVKLYDRRIHKLAELLFATAVAMDEKQHFKSHYYLGLLYEAQGSAVRAVRAYEAYLQMDATSQWAAAARARIAKLRPAGGP